MTDDDWRQFWREMEQLRIDLYLGRLTRKEYKHDTNATCEWYERLYQDTRLTDQRQS